MRESLKDSGRLQHMLEMARMLEEKKSGYTLDDIKSDTILFIKNGGDNWGSRLHDYQRIQKHSHRIALASDRRNASYIGPRILYYK